MGAPSRRSPFNDKLERTSANCELTIMKSATDKASKKQAPARKPPAGTNELADVKPIVECPKELCALAREEWERVVPVLAADGRLTTLDRAPLAIYCNAWVDWVQANAALQTYGSVLKSPSGFPVQSPYVSIASKAAETILRISTEYGFTPNSRQRLPRPRKDDNSDFLDLPSIEDWGADLKELKI
jgi:P27 family predicted phage terminase small subunit